VNVGGEPERDDFGLPPVDIEIPDDARELDRDVQAYHRQLRAQRRRTRLRRLCGPLARDGMVLPLLAGCLVLALVSGTLLTLFSAGQAGVPGLPKRLAASPATGRPKTGPAGAAAATQASGGKLPAGISAPPTPAPGHPGAGSQPGANPAAGPAPVVGQIGGPLPDGTLLVAGQPTRLRLLPPAVFALVPAGCECAQAVHQLAGQAASAHVALYLVGSGTGAAQVGQLAGAAALRTAQVAEDSGSVLRRTYRPSGLTAILVHGDGSVAEISPRLLPGLRLSDQFRQLTPVPQR
jgi:hypothetical protein